MDFPIEKHEITAVSFEPCGRWIGPGSTCESTRRFAIRKTHIGLYCGDGEDAHNHPWMKRLPWANREDFQKGGLFEGWVPENAFPDRRRAPKKQRRGGWDISAQRRAQLEIEIARPTAKCMLCRNTWFRGERNSREALLWLREAERRRLYPEVIDAINKMMPKPTRERPNWYDRLPDDLKPEVRWRFDDSRLYPDHPFSIAFLRAAKKRRGAKFTEALQRFSVDTLAMPLCEACNLGRGARLFERPEDLLQRWADHQFQGSVAAARIHPEYRFFAYLAHLAYETDLVAEVDAQMRRRQHRRGNA